MDMILIGHKAISNKETNYVSIVTSGNSEENIEVKNLLKILLESREKAALIYQKTYLLRLWTK